MNLNHEATAALVRQFEEQLYHLCGLTRDNVPQIRVLLSDEDTYPGGTLEKGFDTLGWYTPDRENEITMFVRNIMKFTEYSQIIDQSVFEIVLIHEIAHSVTHLGLYEGNHWEKFSTNNTPDGGPEHYAQIATWLVLKSHRTPTLLAAFERMSRECQPSE
jgi:hypothetical protein